MTMSNSSLVSYTKISPNKSTRTEKIAKITPHYMAGNLSVETCGNVFAPSSRQASSNYGIGSDGRVGMYVPENYRAWTSSSAWNDQRAVTIEVANVDSYGTITQAAWDTLVSLCVDICKRNGISQLEFTGDKNGSLTWHCMFSDTSCPGSYLKNNTPRLIQEVNDMLNPRVRNRDLQIYDPTLSNINQQFYIRTLSIARIAIRSNACWDWISDPNSSTITTPAQTWGGEGGDDGNKNPRAPQILTLEDADAFGGKYIHPEVAPNLSLGVDGYGNGSQVKWFPHDGKTDKIWHFIPYYDKYLIINAATLKALDVPNGGWK